MLSANDNELLTKTGPGTPMGNLLREYWLPALLSSELPHPDCPPVRVRIMSEDLVAFRATSGEVGLIQAGCPHRAADFFFGRNEEDGIRCTYHGWKFDITGACVDMPSEPEESNYRDKVRATAYPCVEINGAVWTYMGSRETPPPMPDIEAAMRPGAMNARATLQENNWFQSIENNMDTCHLAFMHYGSIPPEAGDDPEWANTVGGADYSWFKSVLVHRNPRLKVVDTPAGVSYTGYRPVNDDEDYHRTMNFLLPCFTMTPAGKLGNGNSCLATVPIDDEHAMEFGFRYTEGAQTGQQQSGTPRYATEGKGAAPAFDDPLIPNGTGPLERFRYANARHNEFAIDRDVQANDKQTFRGYTGMPGINIADRALTASQGRIVDRTQEALGTTDAAIIRARQLVLREARQLQEGTPPVGVDNPEYYRMRSGWAFVPQNADWWEHLRPLREVYADLKAGKEADVPAG